MYKPAKIYISTISHAKMLYSLMGNKSRQIKIVKLGFNAAASVSGDEKNENNKIVSREIDFH